MNLPETITNHELTANTNYLALVQETITDCVEQLELVTSRASDIQTQGGFSRFINKSKNIQELAQYTETIATVQQRTFDLIMLLIGATARMKGDYNIILESIDELSYSYEDNNEILGYLVKVKTMVTDLKEQNERFDNLSIAYEDLRARVEELESEVPGENRELTSIIVRIKKRSILKWALIILAILWFIGAFVS